MTRRSPRLSAQTAAVPVIKEISMKKVILKKTAAPKSSPPAKGKNFDSVTVSQIAAIIPKATLNKTSLVRPPVPPPVKAVTVEAMDTTCALPLPPQEESITAKETLCMDCGCAFTKTTRRVIDACGHAKCRTCFIVSDYQGGCKQCLPAPTPNATTATAEEVTRAVKTITIGGTHAQASTQKEQNIKPTTQKPALNKTNTQATKDIDDLEIVFVKPQSPLDARPRISATRRLDSSKKTPSPPKPPSKTPQPTVNTQESSTKAPAAVTVATTSVTTDPGLPEESPDVIGASLIPAARVALTLSAASDKICLECGTEFNATNHRKLFESCGHLVCWQCFLSWEDGCQQCKS